MTRRRKAILKFAKLNAFHVSMIPYFLEKLKSMPMATATARQHPASLWVSHGRLNLHNHKNVPFFIAGHAGGALKGGLHIKAEKDTPLSNVMLSILQTLGCNDLKEFGRQRGRLDLKCSDLTPQRISFDAKEMRRFGDGKALARYRRAQNRRINQSS